MANIARIRVTWTGGTGGPGLTTFYSDSGVTIPLAALGTFFNAIKTLIPGNITWTIPNSGDIFESTTGALTGTWTQGSVQTINASGPSTNYAGGSGVVINWLTGGIVGNRRARGKTFLVPVCGVIYDNGSIIPSQLSVFSTAAAALVTSSGADLRVWSRPTPSRAGSAHAIVASSVPDLAAVLRSRRD